MTGYYYKDDFGTEFHGNRPVGGIMLDREHMKGYDIHTETACHYYQVQPEDVTPAQYQMGKELNWIGLYGHDIKRPPDSLMNNPMAGIPFIRTTEVDHQKSLMRLDEHLAAELLKCEVEGDPEATYSKSRDYIVNFLSTWGFKKMANELKYLKVW